MHRVFVGISAAVVTCTTGAAYQEERLLRYVRWVGVHAAYWLQPGLVEMVDDGVEAEAVNRYSILLHDSDGTLRIVVVERIMANRKSRYWNPASASLAPSKQTGNLPVVIDVDIFRRW